MLFMLLGVNTAVVAQRDSADAILQKVFDGGDRLNHSVSAAAGTIDTLYRNVHLKYDYRARRRNPTLYFVPSMHRIARGQRYYEGESFGRMKTSIADGVNEIEHVVSSGSIKGYDRLMPTLLSFVTPRLYDVTVFNDLLLSPFHRDNRKFYRYKVLDNGAATVLVLFMPKISNTQLISGYAVIDRSTGNIRRSEFKCEYDLMRTDIDFVLEPVDSLGHLHLQSCDIRTEFRFLGNRVDSRFTTIYECPDSVEQYLKAKNEAKEQPVDTTQVDEDTFFDNALDFLDDHLLSSKKADISRLHVSMSPLVSPFQLGYSNRKGLSYRMKFGAYYRFSSNSNIALYPTAGYSFKQKQFYFEAPLRYTYNVARSGWAEFTIANGNRISDSRLLDIIQDERRDTIDFSALELDYFKDLKLELKCNVPVTPRLDVTLGAVYHRRSSVNKRALAELDRPTIYKSFSPTVNVSWTPFDDGPVISALFQRSIKGIMRSDMEFEKYELDASYKKRLAGLRRFSLRLGGGIYTNMKDIYFVDFVNFHQNYLPGGWDDDWEGEFQLLKSEWYNASKHYARLNVSYESPLMVVSRLPLIGRFVETERIYFSALQLQNTRPYYELGYGFTTRYCSIGAFASILGGKFNDFGCSFSFELFRRW